VRTAVRILCLTAGCTVCFALGYFAHRDGRLTALLHRTLKPDREGAPRPPGEWLPPSGRAAEPSDADREMLASIGYTGASTAAPPHSGLRVNDAQRAQPGLNLYISGHAPEATLMSMDGRPRHRWAYDFAKLWPEYEPPEYVRITGHQYWRRVHAFPNGDLLALHEGIGLIKLDRDSQLLWKKRDNFHHDFAVSSEGLIYALNRTMQPLAPAPGEEPFLMEPILSVLDAGGNELRRVPLLPCFENSGYAPLLKRMAKTGDLFHENTIQVFDGSLAGRSPLFAAGNVLISVWTLDTIAIINLDQQRVLWAMTGLWHRQHESSLLPNANMLVFDNRGNRGGSRVIEFDPFTQQVRWLFAPENPADFHSEWCGGLDRLANGNTLITETNNGRAFEVNSSGEIVWEFINPHQAQSQGTTLIASLWKVTRLPEYFGAEWLAPALE